jgi:nitrogen fixation/metabolism regulation signal transduction histidine kinase
MHMPANDVAVSGAGLRAATKTKKIKNNSSQLHADLVRKFSLMSLLPAAVMFILASAFVFLVIQQWFGERVRTAINESTQVADAYLSEHQQNIRADVLAMANDIGRAAPHAFGDPDFFNNLLRTQSLLRNLQEAIVFDSHHQILARSGLTFSLELDPLDPSVMAAVHEGDVRVILNDKGDRVRALVRLPGFADAYLYVGRLVDPDVIAYQQNAKRAVEEYKMLEVRRGGLQLLIVAIFGIFAVILTIFSVRAALRLADRLATPIGNLISAAERVRSGDFTARVDEHSSYQEITDLLREFNRMTAQLGELEVAQRQAAWGDVARRIAHEIKNPLTPIQLAAERLRRKYQHEIVTEPSVFTNCLDTIVRQVAHVGRMVSEFASFARMPVPVVQRENVAELITQAIFLQRQAHPDYHYIFAASAPVYIMADAGQIAQALTNLLQNSADAIEGREGDNLPPGEIKVEIVTHENTLRILVTDNGRGLPNVTPGRLMEPYMTTRVKGTGLGLAIVKKIIQEHNGTIEIAARTDGAPGATVILQLPLAAQIDTKTNTMQKVAPGKINGL